MNTISLIYCPCPSAGTAEKLATWLLEKKLVACANILPPMQSHYVWQGRLEKTEEYILLAKTSASLAPATANALSTQHPYEIPCILHWEATCNTEYFAWVEEVTKNVASVASIQ